MQKVYESISKVMSAISKAGIAKQRTNEAQRYQFRGIDDVYNAMAPILAEHKLCILPRVTDRQVVERVNKSGTALFYVTVSMDFALVSGEDGSSHVISTIGEAMDSGDKATNKAMSAAYKYALMQAFCIPTEGDNDSENQTHEVMSESNFDKDLEKIASANKDNLRKVYEEVFVKHKKSPDLVKQIEAAKDKRKKELGL
jgi:hypothetical protein